MEDDMYKEIIKLPVIVVVMTQILYSNAHDTGKKLHYATVAQIFNYQRNAPIVITDPEVVDVAVAGVLEKPVTLDKTLQFGLSEEALRFAIRTLISVAVTLKSQHKNKQNFHEFIKRDLQNMPRNGFVMGVTNAILNIMKTENNCGVKDAKQMPATKKKGSTPPATLRKKGRKYQSSNANALED